MNLICENCRHPFGDHTLAGKCLLNGRRNTFWKPVRNHNQIQTPNQCRRCGGEAQIGAIKVWKNLFYHRGSCSKCHEKGPVKGAQIKALLAWNEANPLRCQAQKDGECFWKDCPQLKKRRSHCPLDDGKDHYE